MPGISELVPGVWHWQTEHPRIGVQVSSYWLDDTGTLLDPMEPEEGTGWFADRDPEPQRIVLTCRHHWRDCDRFREAFGVPVFAHTAGLHEFDGDSEVKGYSTGEQLAPGVTPMEMGAICPDDTVLHIEAGPGALAFGDSLIRYGGEIGFVPDALMGEDAEQVKREALERARDLLDLQFDALLFAHGDPLVEGGKQELREFLDR
ncbi:MAG: hypothetical protein ACR2NA_03835 [Solirubrobacterales bacterium]